MTQAEIDLALGVACCSQFYFYGYEEQDHLVVEYNGHYPHDCHDEEHTGHQPNGSSHAHRVVQQSQGNEQGNQHQGQHLQEREGRGVEGEG